MAYLAGRLMLLLSIFGLIHAYVTPKTKAFAAPDPRPAVEGSRQRLTTQVSKQLGPGPRASAAHAMQFDRPSTRA